MLSEGPVGPGGGGGGGPRRCGQQREQEAVQRHCGCDVLPHHFLGNFEEHDPLWRMEMLTTLPNHGTYAGQTTKVRLPYGTSHNKGADQRQGRDASRDLRRC